MNAPAARPPTGPARSERPGPFARAASDAEVLRSRTGIEHFDVAVVLGSGLGAFADAIDDARRLAMADLPGFPTPAVEGHAGEVVAGRLFGHAVLVLSGRVHLYEGRDVHEVSHGVRVAAAAGAPAVVLTNAAGGIRPDLEVGALVRIADHLNLTGANPLSGPHDGPGSSFVDLGAAYDAELRALAGATRPGLPEGIYACVRGPSYETPAEVRALAAIGADLVGMSTACETIAARHLGLRVAGVSLVTNRAGGAHGPLSHRDVTATAQAAADDLVDLLLGFVPAVAAATSTASPDPPDLRG